MQTGAAAGGGEEEARRHVPAGGPPRRARRRWPAGEGTLPPPPPDNYNGGADLLRRVRGPSTSASSIGDGEGNLHLVTSLARPHPCFPLPPSTEPPSPHHDLPKSQWRHLAGGRLTTIGGR
jgi:hypothetical protein